jgi:hypothetical protein
MVPNDGVIFPWHFSKVSMNDLFSHSHSAVKKIDEFLFSKSFHLRSVELHEQLVD